MSLPVFQVETVDYPAGLEDLHRIREAVFIEEQGVPRELERDALDPLSRHVLARDASGNPIGTARLTPDHRIGRMAVLREWRGRGVGEYLLLALLDEARQRGWPDVSLHAQTSAEGFYARHGFIPEGARFQEAGIQHQHMRLHLQGPTAIRDLPAAIATVTALAYQSQRSLWIRSRELDPGLFDSPLVLEALRRLATRRNPMEIRILLQDAATPQRYLAPLLPLAQRLPSVFAFREADDPEDRGYPSAHAVNDTGGWFFRPSSQRMEGETDLRDPARARLLREEFRQAWERARPCSEYRALGL